MKLFGFHSENTTVGAYRIWSPFKWMSKLGLHQAKHAPTVNEAYVPLDPPTDANPDPKYNADYGSIREFYEWADLIVRQKCHSTAWMALVRLTQDKYKLPLIVDSDDDMTHVHLNNPVAHLYQATGSPSDAADDVKTIEEKDVQTYLDKGYEVMKIDGEIRVGKLKPEWITHYSLRMMQMANAVTVTNENLRQVYLKWNKNIHIIPNYIDTDRWEGVVKAKSETGRIRVGWFGGASHYDDLMVIKDVIPAILDKYENVEFYWCGAYPDFWQKDHEAKRWGEGRFVILPWLKIVHEWEKHFASFGFDIALAPLIDSQFNRCKSNIKWMESAMLKIPVVASPVDPYMCINHKQDGFLAGKYIEWIKHISNLIESKDLREETGNRAYERVLAEYNLKDHVHKQAGLYERVRQEHELKKHGIVLGVR